ncbi:MAG TPA: class I SAM-dependent methyltransferase [Stellaceae bacterium]|nr:class I SAM-dependent methyltransferase [Stellaceae bacterium]
MTEAGDPIQGFAERVLAVNPTHRSFISASLAALDDENRGELLSYIHYCHGRGLSLEYLASCYNTVAVDIQMEQIYFKRHGKYRNSSFKEVADQVYFDTEYMKKYMYGLALTYFLWPNHVAMQRFFVNTFPRGKSGKYLEIGPGHGYYFRRAAALGNFTRMVGVDISPASVELSRDIMRHHQVKTGAEIDIQQADFLQFSKNETFSCIVMGEVLEHVEKPGIFLRKVAELSALSTHIYITTCLNAPAIDHIFLFSRLTEVEELAADSGLVVTDRFVAPYVGRSIDECEAERLPVNVAYVMRKQ